MTQKAIRKILGKTSADNNRYQPRTKRGHKKVRSELLTPEAAAAAKARRSLRKSMGNRSAAEVKP